MIKALYKGFSSFEEVVLLEKVSLRKRDKLKKFFREHNYLAVLLGFALLFINILLLTKISFVLRRLSSF